MTGDFSNVWGEKTSDPLRCLCLSVSPFTRGWELLSARGSAPLLLHNPKIHLLVLHLLENLFVPPGCCRIRPQNRSGIRGYRQ